MKSQITGRQIADQSIGANHINSEGKVSVLEERKIGVARIVEGYTPILEDVVIDSDGSHISGGINTIFDCYDVTENVYDVSWQASYDLFKIKKGILTTGREKDNSNFDMNKHFGRGMENYKVFIRNNQSKNLVKNTENYSVYGELFGVEHKRRASYPNLFEMITVNKNSNEAIVTFATDGWFDQNDWLNKVILSWDGLGEGIEKDKEIGYVINVEMGNGTNGLELNQAKFTLKDNATIDYSGYVKSVKYYLKTYSKDISGNEIEYNLPNIDVDFLFIETQGGWEEQPNNTYNYYDFFLDGIANFGSSSVTNLTVTNKLTVGGLIDPTGLIISPSSSNPLGTYSGAGIWTNNNNEFEFNNGINVNGNSLFNNNLTITGNLIVNGDQVIQNSETVLIEDNIITLNNGETGNGISSGMAGIEIDRGTGDKFQIVFVESENKLKAGFVGNLENIGEIIQANRVYETNITASGYSIDLTISPGFSFVDNSESVMVNGLILLPTKYTLTGNTITFNSGELADGDDIFVKFLEKKI